MIDIIPSNERYFGDFGWLKTRWHFSFGDYHDPNNMNFSALRVFNDDIIEGGGEFGMHSHRDMEIITYMVDGTLKHADSLGHIDTLKAGEVQVMSAGRGIMHSEANNSKTEPLRLLQMWIMPRMHDAKPRWEQKPFSKEARANMLLPIVSSGNLPGTLTIDQDAAIYVSSLNAGKELEHRTEQNRHAYFFVITGHTSVNGQRLKAGDQARISEQSLLKIHAEKDSEVILLDLP